MDLFVKLDIPYYSFFQDFTEATMQKIIDWLNEIDLKKSGYYADDTFILARNTIKSAVDSGKNVIIMPHSQGNFYIRDALNSLGLQDSKYYTSSNVIELASPVDEMPSLLRNHTRIDRACDPIVVISSSCFDYGVVGSETKWDISCHSIDDSYLEGEAKNILLNKIEKFAITTTSSTPSTSHSSTTITSHSSTTITALKSSTTTSLTTAVNPTIAQNPMSGPGGTTFAEWGTGFTPNSTATLYFPKYDGVNDGSSQQAIDSIGHFDISYPSGTNKPPGTYKWYAIDGPTGKKSNEVTFTINVNPIIAQTPMSGPGGTTFAEWGTGFTPNSTATLYFPKYDGVNDGSSQQAIDSIGHFDISYPSGTNKPPGTYKWYAVDGPTGTKSNEVTFTITVNPTIAQNPMSGSGGTTFVEWGTGFTPNSTATLYFPKYDGVNDGSSQQPIDSIGHFEISYTSGTNKPKGSYSWYAKDGPTGKKSNTVNFTIN